MKLSSSPFYVQDEFGSHPSTISGTKHKQKPLEDRTSFLLEFVDNILFESYSKIDIEAVLQRVNKEHCDDFYASKSSYLEIEQRGTEILASPFPFERISHPYSSEDAPQIQTTSSTLAIRSSEPILNISSVNAVKKAAEDVWKAEKGESTSRFTLQYSGNSEAHVFDFITTSPTTTTDSAGDRAVSALNEALQRKIYPTIREAFFQGNSASEISHEVDDGTRLFVYDALVIRYNSTKAAEAADVSGETIKSAGQPLHRDLGLVSVNIMLNSADDFEGGGTFFENQLLEEDLSTVEPLKPSGIGYCLAHSASERHAGAGTTGGVRDILVLFISACTGAGKGSDAIHTPAELLSARLKNSRSFCESVAVNDASIDSEEQWMQTQRSILLCRILHQRLAVKARMGGLVPQSLLSLNQQTYCDGEALQYLGTALMEYSSLLSDPNKAIDILKVALECFRVALLVTPCDSRVYNNLGIVLGKIDEMYQIYSRTKNAGGSLTAVASTRPMLEQEVAYRKGMKILQRSIRAGCTNESLRKDLESLTLNYGLFIANQDRFEEAAEILEPIAATATLTEAGEDAYRLWKFCTDRYLEEHF